MPHAPGRAEHTTLLDPVVAIRRVETIDEYRQCEHLQERIWGADGVARVPLLDLLTAQENGGLVLGAFDRDTLVGFVFSFLGLDARCSLKHCSIVLAVAEEHRGRGTGLRLKLAQREAALAQGIDLITWTYDPLLAVNARLNIHRLGAVSNAYRVNHYDTGRGLNTGLETDRLIVEWWLRRERAEPPPAGSAPPVPVAAVARTGGLPVIMRVDPDVDADAVLLPIPADLGTILRCDFGLARQWREQTRGLFQAYFARGYAVVGFDPSVGPAGTATYLLRREVAG